MLAAALALPSVALAQGGASNALTPGLPQPQATIPTNTAPTTTAPVVPLTSTTPGGSSSGLSGGSAIAIAIGAVIVLGGIAYFIWWDARKRAPRRGRLAAAGVGAAGRRAGSKPAPKPRKLSPAERRRRKRGRAR
jgi:predicted lipid-binding transport protein (Tim44 family)